jgi:hypothetical protein
VVYSVISAVSKAGFGIFLAHLICLKSEKAEMPGYFQVHVSRITLIKALKKCPVILKLWTKSFLHIRVSWNLNETISFRDLQEIL